MYRFTSRGLSDVAAAKLVPDALYSDTIVLPLQEAPWSPSAQPVVGLQAHQPCEQGDGFRKVAGAGMLGLRASNLQAHERCVQGDGSREVFKTHKALLGAVN